MYGLAIPWYVHAPVAKQVVWPSIDSGGSGAPIAMVARKKTAGAPAEAVPEEPNSTPMPFVALP